MQGSHNHESSPLRCTLPPLPPPPSVPPFLECISTLHLTVVFLGQATRILRSYSGLCISSRKRVVREPMSERCSSYKEYVKETVSDKNRLNSLNSPLK